MCFRIGLICVLVQQLVLRIASAKLGWTSAVELYQVEVHVENSELLLSIERLTTEKTLAALFLNLNDWGEIRIDRPVLNVQFDGRSSSLEDSFATWTDKHGHVTRGKDKGTRRPNRFSLIISSGRVLITDVASSLKWMVEPIEIDLKMPTDHAISAELSFSTHVKRASLSEASTGTVNVMLKENQLSVQSDRLPLGVLGALLRRYRTDLRLSGTLSCDLRCRLGDSWEQPLETFGGYISADGFEFGALEAMSDEVLCFDRIVTEGDFRFAANRCFVDLLKVTSDFGQLSGHGIVHLTDNGKFDWRQSLRAQDFMLRGNVELAGELEYDAGQLSRALRGYLGPDFLLNGRKKYAFMIRGPAKAFSVDTPTNGVLIDHHRTGLASWISPELVAAAGFGWDSGQVFGLEVGAADLELSLSKGVLRVLPFEIGVGQGRLRSSPVVLLNQPTPELSMDRTSMLDRVTITQQMCATWLKYVTPLLADATRIDGQLSVHLDHVRAPLDAPQKSDVAGVVTIHAGQVRPGPLVEPIVGIVNQIRAIVERRPLDAFVSSRPLMTFEEQHVRFQLTQGRVHHQGMWLRFGDVNVETYGDVGLDQSLNLTARIPIPDSWVRDDPVLGELQGRFFEIPICGSLSRPRVDPRSLEKIAQQLLEDSLQRIIERGVFKGIDRLLGPQK